MRPRESSPRYGRRFCKSRISASTIIFSISAATRWPRAEFSRGCRTAFGLIFRSRRFSSRPLSPLVPILRRDDAPSSFGQRALWFHEQLQPGSPAYNLLSVYRLSGELDAALLEKSINRIIARHEVLRTVFEAADGEPVQKILSELTLELQTIDLSHPGAKSSQDAEVRRIAVAAAERPFDLTRGPLLRAALLKLANHEHVFLLVIHHIVFDGWSTGVFFRELSQ